MALDRAGRPTPFAIALAQLEAAERTHLDTCRLQLQDLTAEDLDNMTTDFMGGLFELAKVDTEGPFGGLTITQLDAVVDYVEYFLGPPIEETTETKS